MLLLCCHTLFHCAAIHSYTRAQRQAQRSYAFVAITDGNVIHFTILGHICIIFVFYFFVLKFED